jgi:hypothetical protein
MIPVTTAIQADGEGLRSHNPTRKLFSVVGKLTGRGCVWRLLFNDVLIKKLLFDFVE